MSTHRNQWIAINRPALAVLAAISLCLTPAGLALSQASAGGAAQTMLRDAAARARRPSNPVVAAARAWAARHHMSLHPPARFLLQPISRQVRRADGGTIGPNMATVTAAELQGGGVVLSAPYTDSPPISAAQADAAATAFEGQGMQWVVRETVLADYTGGEPPGTVDRLTWVVSLEAPDGTIPSYFTAGKVRQGQFPTASGGDAAKYLIVLVDANTGDIIFSQESTA